MLNQVQHDVWDFKKHVMDNISEADKVLIEKYVLGQPLTMDEQAQFNNRSKDTDFETALLWEQDIHVALQVEGRKQLKREFQTLEIFLFSQDIKFH